MSALLSPKLIILTASSFGFFQGVIWALLSFIAIICHWSNISLSDINFLENSYQEVMDKYFFQAFIKDRGSITGYYIQPLIFVIFMFIYLFSHISWAVSSALIYIGPKRNFSRRTNFQIGVIWLAVTAGIIIFDLIFFSLIAHDYSYAIKSYNETQNKIGLLYMVMVYGIMMTIVARGYILWILNLVIFGITAKYYYDSHFKNKQGESRERLYGATSMTRPELFPDEAVNDFPNPRRRSEPPPTLNRLGVNRGLRTYDNYPYIYDPHIEKRLAKYKITKK